MAAQQTYVTRFDAFVGSAYLNSPHISLPENGFQFQIGMRKNTWMSLGFDYSRVTGDMSLTPDLLPNDLQQKLSGQLQALAAAGRLPAGYKLQVKADSTTQTFAMGPQFSYRHWKPVTLFIRPSCGAIRELATPKPADPIATGITAQLTPEGHKMDWTGFYGVGGGVDWNPTRHVGLRIQADLVRDHLFNDILRDARNTFRMSIGPAFNFGRNIVKY